MWLVWTVSALSAAVFAGCLIALREDWRAAPPGWKLLAASGVPLAMAGLGFILRFWEPSPGPFVANELYPLGPYVNAWAVSFGFLWLAFGVAWYALALRAPHDARSWVTLLAAWVLAWVPHGIIAAGFAAAGDLGASAAVYQEWASRWQGSAGLGLSALILIAYFALSGLGFALTGKALRRSRRPDASS